MKIKIIIALLIAVASLFPFVETASAASCFSTGVSGQPGCPTGDLNIYGASAQFAFWQHEFPYYLAQAGCQPANGSWANSSAQNDPLNPSHYVVQANCTPCGGAATVNFRVSSKASYDGPAAVDGQVTPYTVNNCLNNGGTANQREMLHVNTGLCAWGQQTCPTPAAVNGDCEVVTWGSADVAVGDLQQVTTGASGRNFKLNPLILNTAVDFCHPNAIAFSFWVNNSVTSQAGPILSNIQALEAKMIYSGKLTNWNQLASTAMNAAPITVCSRTAGSGTAASLDFQIARPASLIAVPSASHLFEDSTSNEVGCVNTNAGAIGVFDSDRIVTGLNVTPLTLNGVAPSAATLEDASYIYTDGAQHAYVQPATAATSWINDVCLWAGWPTRTAIVSPTWAATCNMKFLPGGNGSGSLNGGWQPTTVFGTMGCTCP